MIPQIIAAIGDAIENIRSWKQIAALGLVFGFGLLGYLIYLNGENLKLNREIIQDSTRASLSERISISDKDDLDLIARTTGAQTIALVIYQGIRATYEWSNNPDWLEEKGFNLGDEWLILDNTEFKEALEDPAICIPRDYQNKSAKFEALGIVVSVPIIDPITDKLEGRLALIFRSGLNEAQITTFCTYLRAGAKSLRD